MIFSCTSRRHTLGTKTNEEFSVFRENAADTPFVGFYCYGEIGTLTLGEPTKFHNDTYIALAFYSKK